MQIFIFLLSFVWCMAMHEVFENNFWTAMFMGIVGSFFITVIVVAFSVAVGA